MQSFFRSFSFLVAFLCTACTTTQKVHTEQPTRVVLDSTQIFTIYSKTTQQNYQIQLSLPGGYETNPKKKYPIIIKLDGQWDFPLAASVYNNIYYDGQMPQTIIAGIGWADIDADTNIHAIRARDLLPASVVGFGNSGQAKKFVEALVNDIIPELNNRVRLNGQEFLLGGSWGAVFATFALLERPDVFDGAIAIAGNYLMGSEVFDQQIKTVSQSKTLAGNRLYIGVGAQDAVTPTVTAYAEKLQQAQLKNFNFKFDYLDGFGHSGMNVPGYAYGYRHMFARPQLSLPQETLNKYVGKYLLTEAEPVEMIIHRESQGLVASINGNQIQLFASSDNSFYQEGSFFNITFDDSTAKVEIFSGEKIFHREKIER